MHYKKLLFRRDNLIGNVDCKTLHQHTFLSFQSYFIGCSFNAFSQSWSDRSYIITLIVFAWMVPTIMIFISHVAILYRVRHSNIKDMLIKKFSCGLSSTTKNGNLTIRKKLSMRRNTSSAISSEKSCLPHLLQRVSPKPKY